MPDRRQVVGGLLALGCPAVARAQWGRPRVALVSWNAPSGSAIPDLVDALKGIGLVHDETVQINTYYADTDPERMKTLAAEIARSQPAVIVTFATPAVVAMSAATKTIPIVVASAADLVGTGLAASLARPGGNVTGVSLALPELAQKRLEILTEMLPGLRSVAFLGSTADPAARLFAVETDQAARRKGLQFKAHYAEGAGGLARQVGEAAAGGARALIVQPLFVGRQRTAIIETAARLSLPTISDFDSFAKAGGMASYGPSLQDMARRAAPYVRRILDGAQPGDLPIEMPSRFQLVINLATARALGVTVPLTIQQIADELLE